MDAEKNSIIVKIFTLALQNQNKNELKVALQQYNEVLTIDPDHVKTLNNIGIIFFQLKEYQKAITYFDKTIKIDPNYLDPKKNLGVTFNAIGEYTKAAEIFEILIRNEPNDSKSHYNLGIIYQDSRELQKGINCYEKAIELDPNNVNAHNNLGSIFQTLGEHQKAKDYFDKVIEMNPNYINALNNAGSAAASLGRFQEAEIYFKKAIEIDPNFMEAIKNFGIMLYDTGNYKESTNYLKKALELDPTSIDVLEAIGTSNISKLDNLEETINFSYRALKIHHKNSKLFNQSIPLFRLKHDVQQANYLNSKDYKINGIDEFIKVGDEILKRKENKEDESNSIKVISLNPNEINSLLPYFKENHIYKTKTISGSCINPNKNWLEVEEEYLNSSKQIMYIDDFLSDEALIELREFCLVSKVWNKEYDNDYLGAFSNSGFISPIHLQIAIDLQKKLPKLFGPHRLGTFWGFKYDATLGKGINIHADFAIHNLNFWITPDEYNNNKNSGGLKVYDAPAPDHWTFNNYNINAEKIYEFLKENNAKCTNIPYKFNRAVLFNSAYFHETDEIDFKDEYVGRRINNTYLFGSRIVKQKT